MAMTIWIDSWQMQCCGEPFRLGSQVAWTLRAADPEFPTMPSRPGGTVRHIAAVHCRLAPEPGSDSPAVGPVAGTGVLTDVGSADGWTEDRGDEHFIGYLVQLEL
jgi:hypothetical protein